VSPTRWGWVGLGLTLLAEALVAWGATFGVLGHRLGASAAIALYFGLLAVGGTLLVYQALFLRRVRRASDGR
jgi:hypothetical protein